jgi:hypothetical protein
MSTLTRSKDELGRIVALLESDAYDTEEQLAFAVLKEAADILADRHLFAVWSRSHPDVLWGPYFTEAQAEKGWRMDVGPVLGAEGGNVLRIAPWPATPAVHEDKDYYPLAVCMCGHPRWRHTNSGKRTYCGNRKDGCKCGGFTRP